MHSRLQRPRFFWSAPRIVSPGLHSGQTTEHARDLSSSGDRFWSLSRFITKFSRSTSRSTSFTRAISVLRPIILPLQTFFSRVLLLRQQAFSSGNLLPERPTTKTTAIKHKSSCFATEHVNSTRKFTIVAEIVSLLKKIYKRYAPFRVVLKVKTLAVMFPSYHRKMKTNTAKFKSAAILSLAFFYEKHAHSFDRWGPLAWSNTGSPRFTDFPSLCACSASSLTNLIGSGLNLLC